MSCRINTSCILMFLAILIISTGCHAESLKMVGYFRFEKIDKNSVVVATDRYESGNEFRAFNDGATPQISEEVPFAIVPQTGEPNQNSVDFTRMPQRPMAARDLFLVGSEKHLNPNTDELEKWTLEASVKFARAENFERSFQTFIGREGYNIPNLPADREHQQNLLGFKKRGDRNHISIEAWDSENHYVVAESPDPVEPETWYNLAAVCDGTTLTLWIKGPKDQAFVKKGSSPFSGALKNNNGLWTLGRGFFGNQIAERFIGTIDEVRLSAEALDPKQFIATQSNKAESVVLLPKSVEAPETVVTGDFGSSRPMSSNLIHPHDPMVIRQGDEYHLFATHGGINHFKSLDLIHWTESDDVFPTRPDWIGREIAGRVGLWAPDIAFFNNQFHLYYSASTFGSKRSLIGLVTTDSLKSNGKINWSDQGKVVESFRESEFNAIDPSVWVAPDESVWMSWGSFNRGIYLAELNPSTGRLKDEKSILHLAERKGNTSLEAPQLFYHNGWYYLFVNYDACCRGAASTYKILVGRSKQITGPYLDRENRPMLEGNASLVVRSYDHLRGPGHASFIQKDGQWMMAHHYYDARRFGVATLAVRPMYFDVDGWPLVGEPIGESTSSSQPASISGTWIGLTDDLSPANFILHPDGSANRGKLTGTWSTDHQKIRVIWKLSENISHVEEGFLSQDQRSYVARRSDGAIIRAGKN